ncbi:chaperone protein DNAJ [Strigomonas culicis]|uniref:Chaperone protein DNAJ n=1 Tax=Strigomonas culicis TaxID=28005 RepID=S9V278_9TRYP|nr:chaperone protein DNAJ [Strigomonas culicis]EPY35078.1 chaperone protein DNAJ [Strigomonas culicis]|eukprot:EPY27782.1 chaperone protein DNAJ [Strigomonas culicis]
MFRRSILRLAYEDHGGVSGDRGLMTLQQACTIFGFQLDEDWNKKEVKKRFKKLALKFHPDHGGTTEQFLMLKEAENIMMTHRHDRGKDRAKQKGDVNFKRMNYDDLTGTIHRQTADRKEYRSFGIMDFAVFLVVVSSFLGYYVYNAYQTQKRIVAGRWSYTTDQLKEYKGNKDRTSWHPWKTDNDTRDTMDTIGVLQGNVRREVVEERRREAPAVYTPWQAGGPLARNMVAQKYGDTETEAPK